MGLFWKEVAQLFEELSGREAAQERMPAPDFLGLLELMQVLDQDEAMRYLRLFLPRTNITDFSRAARSPRVRLRFLSQAL